MKQFIEGEMEAQRSQVQAPHHTAGRQQGRDPNPASSAWSLFQGWSTAPQLLPSHFLKLGLMPRPFILNSGIT